MKELIERLRFQTRYTQGQVPVTMDEAADALERLTQPVDMEPDYEVWKSTDSCNEFWAWEFCDKAEYDKTEGARRRAIYSGEQVARLQAELAEAVSAVQRLSAGQPFDAVVIADGIKRGVAEALAATEPKGTP